jgi:hypothetical protein
VECAVSGAREVCQVVWPYGLNGQTHPAQNERRGNLRRAFFVSLPMNLQIFLSLINVLCAIAQGYFFYRQRGLYIANAALSTS